ncbi:MAG: hypothetical protein COU10_02335 [Candidatus Harrisonbacteria bacterium CG10_big_fil_rev_8_21_14_0_10_45_28]|uniref:Dipeptidylpeptidase IV N-terminal domain-containing protein n=1 Tax=Candidatus Harrisonbacteria bacterium CG10_big_fil_rev_8_21_14_0_10_45_28 TaxID=1974586 RepID=A0A2H0UN67_9BACT|nr:MAG: hypothetical protein COU10_02335 [Candidatus Harrisonbacteria bacterium CG10_big_fil_rev_8_21_14_0_10_45_28]
MSRKKILLIILVLALVTGGILVYYYLSRQPATEPLPVLNNAPGPLATGETQDPAVLEEIAKTVPRLIVDGQAKDFWISDNGGIFYIDGAGGIFRTEPNTGESEKLSTVMGGPVRQISPARNGDRVLLSFIQDDVPYFRIFNTLSRSWLGLPDKTLAAAWSPDNKKIAYLASDGAPFATLYILTVESGRSEATGVSLPVFDPVIGWPVEEKILLSSSVTSKDAGALWAVNLKNQKLAKIDDANHGLVIEWAPEAGYGLAFSTERGLFAMGLDGEVVADLDLVTLPEKCSVGDEFIYCGTGGGLRQASLPDSYWTREKYSNDDLMIISVEGDFLSLKNSLKMADGRPLDIYRPKINGDILYFINKYNGAVYSLKIDNPFLAFEKLNQ